MYLLWRKFKPKTYSVTLIAGEGLTHYPYHGAEQQTNLLGAMEPVYYTADEDYYIQDDYPMITKMALQWQDMYWKGGDRLSL